MRTSHPRIKVENYGPGNWRTVAQDDSGEWAITGPPYPTRAEALGQVDHVALYYFGSAADIDAARAERARAGADMWAPAVRCATIGCRELVAEVITYRYQGTEETSSDQVCGECADSYSRHVALVDFTRRSL